MVRLGLLRLTENSLGELADGCGPNHWTRLIL